MFDLVVSSKAFVGVVRIEVVVTEAETEVLAVLVLSFKVCFPTDVIAVVLVSINVHYIFGSLEVVSELATFSIVVVRVESACCG